MAGVARATRPITANAFAASWFAPAIWRIAVLHQGPITSPVEAVRAAIVAEHRGAQS